VFGTAARKYGVERYSLGRLKTNNILDYKRTNIADTSTSVYIRYSFMKLNQLVQRRVKEFARRSKKKRRLSNQHTFNGKSFLIITPQLRLFEIHSARNSCYLVSISVEKTHTSHSAAVYENEVT